MRLLAIFFLFSFVSTARCAVLEGTEAIEVQLAVVHAEMRQHQSAASDRPPLRYCLSTSGTNGLQPGLLSAMAKVQPEIRPKSECGDECVVPQDFAADRFPCVFIVIGTPVELEDGEVIVRSSFMAGPLFGRGSVYHLRQTGGTWSILRRESEWVS